MTSSAKITTMAVIALGAAGCEGGTDTAQGVAERFLDEHYVRMDLERAKPYCVGVALQKIEEMQHLIGGEKIDETTRKPHVSYDLEKTTEESAERASFLFRGRIRVEDADEFTRHWLVTTRKEPDGGWKVSNFQEFE
jgi:hypothetical protein